MRTKQLISGLNNNQKIRVICEGVMFNTTVKDALEGMGIYHQRVAVFSALNSLGCDQRLPLGQRPTGFGSRIRSYKADGTIAEVDVQVDLL